MNSSRRSFLKWTGASLAALPFLSRLSLPATAADLPMIKETDALPKSLGVCMNADKPTAQCKDRKAKDKKDQYCYNCQLFTKSSGAGKTEVGKCMLMPTGSMPGQGWCKSWVKKPA